jgi:hypothetical protein
VNIVFHTEEGYEVGPGSPAATSRGPFRSQLVAHDGRMSSVQVFLDGVVGGHIVDLDTTDGESRVIFPERGALDRALGTAASGYFAVAAEQVVMDEE